MLIKKHCQLHRCLHHPHHPNHHMVSVYFLPGAGQLTDRRLTSLLHIQTTQVCPISSQSSSTSPFTTTSTASLGKPSPSKYHNSHSRRKQHSVLSSHKSRSSCKKMQQLSDGRAYPIPQLSCEEKWVFQCVVGLKEKLSLLTMKRTWVF